MWRVIGILALVWIGLMIVGAVLKVLVWVLVIGAVVLVGSAAYRVLGDRGGGPKALR